jgi:hypothetical protein
MKKLNIFYIFIITLFLLINSCATFNQIDPYQNMRIMRYGNSQAYFFPNNKSNKLIINIEGSGFHSVLGIKNEERWQAVGLGAQLIQVLGDEYAFLIPEKFSRQPGINYENDMEDREKYTAENLLECYMESINGFLNEFNYSSIVLIGTSEGACLLPLIYLKMDSITRNKVSVMVSFGFGGLSLYESYTILNNRTTYQGWKDFYSHFLDLFKLGQTDHPDTFDELHYGFTYRWFNSIKDIRPFDYYKNIDIPVLFFHGYWDQQVAVESMVYIADNLKGKPFQYWLYDWAHQPETETDIINFRNDIALLIRQTDK